MDEKNQYNYSHKELVTALVKDHNIHEGFWMLNVQFGLAAASLEDQSNPGILNPAAIVPLLSIGIIKTKTNGLLSIDAAVVNPASGTVDRMIPKKPAGKLAPKKPAGKLALKKPPGTPKKPPR